jgi:predicted deacylase
VPQAAPFEGPATPLDHIEMIRAPAAGTILFHRDVGDTVSEGDLLATLITAPGMADGTVDVRAPQAGLIVTRCSQRFARFKADLMKIACSGRTKADRKPGTLED